MSGDRIPIENIYGLLCYAWDRLDEAEMTPVSMSSDMRLPELFARVLRSGVTHLLKRGLNQAYVTTADEIAGVRGRLDISNSVKRATFPRARASCEFDELSPDTAANRILKTTLRELARVTGLSPELGETLRDLYRRMPGVQETRITGQSFRRITLGSNTSYYGFLLDVCELVHRNLLIDETTGNTIFRDFTRDDAQMARLFERFLLRFYQHELPGYTVEARQLKWNAAGEPEALAYLPRMQTDIVLSNSNRFVVIDAKYYANTLSHFFGKATIRSEHMYQIFAYMQHLGTTNETREVSGVLLYPRTTQTVHIPLKIFGSSFIAATVDLTQPWQRIEGDLLALVD